MSPDPNNTLDQRREERDRVGADISKLTEQRMAETLAIMANLQHNFIQMHTNALQTQLDIYKAWGRHAELISRNAQDMNQSLTQGYGSRYAAS